MDGSEQTATDRGQWSYRGGGWTAFKIAFFGTFFTVLTIGVYRFWMKTALRRHHWGRLKIGDEPFEYRGRALELLIGWLLAIVIIAIYVTIIYVGFNFASIALFDPVTQGLTAPALLAGLPLVILWPYAIYRAQRYFVSRLSWRGVRLSLGDGAWRYLGVSWLWTILQSVSLGLLTPIADFKRREFITRRMAFGDREMRLEGGAVSLYRYLAPFVIFLICTVAAVIAADIELVPIANGFLPIPRNQEAFLASNVLAVCTLFSLFYYRTAIFAYFIRNTKIAGVPIESTISGGKLFWLTIGASLLTSIALVIAMAPLLYLARQIVGPFPQFVLLDPQAPFEAKAVVVSVFVGVYVTAIALYSGFWQAFYMRRAFTVVARRTRVADLSAVDQVRQSARGGDDAAEGFADALDVSPF